MSLSRSLQYLFLAIIVTTVGFSLYQWNASRASTQKTAPNNGLVGYWSFDEGTGTQAGDASGNGNTGTLTNGPTWTTGKLGQAINFDGVDDYVTIGTTGQSTNSFSFGAWIKTSATHEIDSEASSGVGGVSGQKYAFTPSYKASPSSGAGLSVGTNGISVYEHSDAYLPPLAVYSGTIGSGWNYIMIVYNSKTPSIYLNGVLVRTGLTSPKTTVYPPDHIDDITSYGSFAGQIDEVRIYNRALSGTEITNLYNLGAEKLNVSPVSNLTSGLVGYWTFDGKDTPWTSSSAGTATDRSGNGNTGTLTNMSQSTSPIIGKIGQALKFDGTNDEITTTTNQGNGSAAGLQTLSLSAWFNTSDGVGGKKIVGLENAQTGTGSTQWDRELYLGTDGKIHAYVYDTIQKQAVSTSLYNDGRWHHAVATISANDSIKLYVDGMLQQSTAIGTPFSTYTTSYWRIGGWKNAQGSPFNGSDGYFSGQIDEVRIYNRALSATEVQSLYDLGASDKMNSSVSQSQGGNGNLYPGLVGYWKLDDGSGTTATDSSGNADNGTLTNSPTWGTGKIGSALTFASASSQRITVTHNAVLNVYPLTVSAWVKTTTNDSSARAIVGKYVSGQSTYGGYILYLYQGNIRGWYFKDGSNNVYDGAQGMNGGSINDGAWHLISLVIDASGGKIYVDGVQKDSRGWTGTPGVMTGTQPVCIGVYPTNLTDCTAGSFFDGTIDDVRVYNRALSGDEISQLYRFTGVDASLKGYWSFDGSTVSGTTAYDSSGNGNNGTLTNSPTRTIGKLGQALNFNGSNNYVSMGSTPTTGFPLTTSAWFKTTDATASYRSISSIYGSSNSAIAILQFDSGGGGCANSKRVKYVVRDTSGGASTSICSSNDLNDGAWHHVVGVSSSASNHTLYIDGVSQGNSTTSLGATAFNSMQVSSYAGTQYFPGSTDEVRVYNRALSATEITALYNSGR